MGVVESCFNASTLQMSGKASYFLLQLALQLYMKGQSDVKRT